MLPRLLLLAGLIGLTGISGTHAQEDLPTPRPVPTQEPPKKEEPKKPKEEPKKPKEEPKPKDEPKKEDTKSGTSVAPGSKFTPPKAGALKKYDDVVTKDFKTTPGVFAVHKFDERVLFEIPAEKLNKLIMLRAEVAKGSGGSSYNGAALGTKFVRFERKENKIFVIEAGFDKRSGTDTQAAVEASYVEPIIASFPVECEGKDRSAVISVSQVFMNDTLDLGARRGGSIDSEKSFLTDVKSFPLNIEVRAQLTLRGGGGGLVFGPNGPVLGGGGSSTRTTLIHYSLYLLPDEPMKGRYYDRRVGYFTEGYSDFSSKKTWVEDKQLIARYRLEKKDPSAELSEPVKPITFYLAPEIPAKFRDAMKKGVEDWKPAFEKAGFKNAIICKDPPTRAEDPNWDAEDARYSVIRWVAEPVANAMGPHVSDPRSGEVISSHIIFWHDILKIVHMWYFVECSAQDERARKFPFPDDLQNELIRYVVAHEVGHTLGLRHNHRASQAYSIEQLRDPKFLEKNGNVASIMSYGRYNYVAQPEDKIPVKDLIPKLAPYDFFAIEWGYKSIVGSSPDAELATLDEWASRQLKEPFLRFGGEDGQSSVDPTVLTENIGSDPVKATELGFKNIDRVLDYILASTTAKGEDFDTLQEAYTAVQTHRRNWMFAVLKQVGGVTEARTLGGRGEQYSRISKEKQKAAVKFIIDNGFTTSKKMMDPAILNNLQYSNVASGLMSFQRSLLTQLLSSGRLNRLLDAEVMEGEKAYAIAELVSDVQYGVWAELKSDAPKIDPLRRNLQRTFVDTLKAEFETPAPSGGLLTIGRRGNLVFDDGPSRNMELRAVARVALKDLLKQINDVLPKVKDATTKLHLQDLASDIELVFEKKK